MQPIWFLMAVVMDFIEKHTKLETFGLDLLASRQKEFASLYLQRVIRTLPICQLHLEPISNYMPKAQNTNLFRIQK